MTCICGLVHASRVYLAADSAIEVGETRIASPTPKVAQRGGVLIGAAGDARACDLVLTWDWVAPEGDPYRWLVRDVAPALRADLDEHGASAASLDVLVGVAGELWYLDSAGAAVRCPDYYAVGAGAQVALGSLHGSGSCAEPHDRLRVALEAAAAWCPAVAGPWIVVAG